MGANVVLIGMPGVGKSTLGVLLARRLGYSFVDTDLLIQARYGQSLQDVVDTLGQEAFRAVEEATCLELSVDRTVVATGGSVVYFPRAMEALGRLGPRVWLDLDAETVRQRIALFPDRGLTIAPGQTLQDLYDERRPLYERYADIRIDANGLSPDRIVQKLKTALAAGPMNPRASRRPD